MSHLKSRRLSIALFLLYLITLTLIVMFKTRFSFRFLYMMFDLTSPNMERSVNLIPFGGMLRLNGKPNYDEIFYNFLVFVPFGILLPILNGKKNLFTLMAPVIAASLLFEVLQYIFLLGASDITDVIANTLGGLAGIGVFFGVHKIFRENAYPVINAIAIALCACFAVILLVAVRPL